MTSIRVFSLSLFCLLILSANASAEILSGETLRKAVSGKTVYLSIALGVELPIKYKSTGHMTGKVNTLLKIVNQANK